jgi:alkylhydroperoxidase family enzyme
MNRRNFIARLGDTAESPLAALGPAFKSRACGSKRGKRFPSHLPYEPPANDRGRMARIRTLDRAELNDEQGRVYDTAKAKYGVGGPYIPYIRVPKLFEAAHHMREVVTSGPLTKRELQLTNLVITRHHGTRYAWSAWARHARAAGIDEATIETINAGKLPEVTDARERMCLIVVKELLGTWRLSDATYQAAEKALGLEFLIGLVANVGSLSMTCLTLNVFEIDPLADDPTPLKT